MTEISSARNCSYLQAACWMLLQIRDIYIGIQLTSSKMRQEGMVGYNCYKKWNTTVLTSFY